MPLALAARSLHLLAEPLFNLAGLASSSRSIAYVA
jgi:hypothetical protein